MLILSIFWPCFTHLFLFPPFTYDSRRAIRLWIHWCLRRISWVLISFSVFVLGSLSKREGSCIILELNILSKDFPFCSISQTYCGSCSRWQSTGRQMDDVVLQQYPKQLWYLLWRTLRRLQWPKLKVLWLPQTVRYRCLQGSHGVATR